jgi:hypothetical protein
MASMVDSSPRSIWETRPGVTPMVSANWAWVRPRCLRSSASRCPPALPGHQGLAAPLGFLGAADTLDVGVAVPLGVTGHWLPSLCCPFLQVDLAELLDTGDHPCVPLVPAARLIAGDEQDRRSPRVEDEQDADLAPPAGSGPKLLEVRDS